MALINAEEARLRRLANPVALTFDEEQIQKTKEAISFYENQVQASLTTMANFEPDSWEAQRNEWNAYQLDVNSSTPYCDALYTARGITKVDLMTKIGLKVISVATIQGTLHGKLDQIEAATTITELDLITL